jgi:S1-C subfamily serine protease
MELSDEQKKRILDEEQQRLAEEQYRAQVRRELQSQAGTGTAAAPAMAPAQATTRSNTLRNVLIVAGVVVVLILVVVLSSRQPGSKSNTATVFPALDTKTGEKSDRPSPLSPPPPTKLTTAQIADLATPSVVIVENFNEDGEKAGQGSGYVYTADGTIITNYHVVRGAKSVSVRIPNKGSLQVDSLLGYSIENDVAAVQVSDTSLTALATEQAQQVKVGDRVVAIGAPLGLESTVSEGIVSALRDAAGTHIIQTTASISPGSSGGPLLNEYGKVIGLTTAHVRDGQSLNFVVASTHITDLLSHRRRMSLEEMLSETQVSQSLSGSTISVPARNAVQLPFAITGQQGATLEGSYTVSGGSGRDVAVALLTAEGTPVVNSGRVSGFGQFRQRLKQGRYNIVFDNRFSSFSSKSVSPDLKLIYYR